MKRAQKGTQKSPKSTPATSKDVKGFTDEERAAMKERIQELKADKAGGGKRRAREDRRELRAELAERPAVSRVVCPDEDKSPVHC